MGARKKKNQRKFLVVTIAVVLFFIILNFLFVKPRVFYPGFEIELPYGYNIHGIDVSHYQSNIRWEEVKAMKSRDVRIGFAFIKATEGAGNTDRSFKSNWHQAAAFQIPRGAYHFYVPGRGINKQAQNFIKRVRLQPGDLPPVLDIEKSGRLSVSAIQSDARQWLNLVEAQYGVTPIIYTNISFYEKYFNKGFERYPIWIAHYLQPNKPRTGRKWSFWQHSETGRVNGINGMVDFNVFYGDSTDFNNLRIP